METFILKLAVAVIPLVILVASVTISSRCTRHPLSRHRRCRHMLRSVIPVVALIALVTVSTGVARNVERNRTAAVPQDHSGPEISVSSVSSMMNGLYAASGR